MQTAELVLTPGTAKILLDGTDVANSVESLVLTAGFTEMPRLRLKLVMALIEVDGQATVTIPEATRNALVELGWTPPAGEP